MTIASDALEGLKFIDFSHKCMNPREVCLIDRSYDFPLVLSLPCHSRFEAQCPECSHNYRKVLLEKVRSLMSLMHEPRFLTLTVRYDKMRDRMREPLNELHRYRNMLFKRLRRRRYSLGSWFAIVELPNHLHIVFDGDYIPRDEIVDSWKEITGGSWNVDIRRVDDDGWSKEKVCNYLTKYVTKSFNDIAGYTFEELKGLRMFVQHGFGTFSKEKEPFTVQFGEGLVAGELGWRRISSENFFNFANSWLAGLVDGRPQGCHTYSENYPRKKPSSQDSFVDDDEPVESLILSRRLPSIGVHYGFEPYDYEKRVWLPYKPKEE